MPATRAARSGSAAYTGMPSGPSSLKENGTEIRRPSNSGIATCIAASIGDSAASEASHTARELVRHMPWMTGTSSVASAPASQPSSAEAPRRQDGHDDRVGAAEQLHQALVGGAQRAAEDRQRVAARGLDPRAEGVDERGVAGQLVRPVEDDADGRAVRAYVRLAVQAVRGHLLGRRPRLLVAGREHPGEEARQLAQVADAALAQVVEGLGGHTGRHRRQRHQLGVGVGLTAQCDQRQAAAAQVLDALAPGLEPAQKPYDDGVRALAQGVEVVEAEAGRVAGRVPGRSGRQQLGVGGGEQQHAHV